MGLLTLSSLLLTLVLVLACLLGDYLVLTVLLSLPSTIDAKDHNNNHFLVLLRCFVDNGVHGLVGFLSWVIVVVLEGGGGLKDLVTLRGLLPRFGFDLRWLEVVVCGVLASVVDVDHFLEAGSFDIDKVIHLPHRPFLHCTTIPLVIFPATVLANQLFHYPRLERAGLLVLVAFLSHHLRDAWRRGLWLSPFADDLPVSYWGYIAAVAVLPNLVGVYVAWRSLGVAAAKEVQGEDGLPLLEV